MNDAEVEQEEEEQGPEFEQRQEEESTEPMTLHDGQPVIRRGPGRPKGWRKPDPPELKEIDTISLLRKELQHLRSEMQKIQDGRRAEKTFGLPPQPPQAENKAFKGRPMPDPLPRGFPEIDPMAGDKTPAVVEWFRDNDPDEFAARYKARKTHLRESLRIKQERDARIIDDEDSKVSITRGTDPNLNTSARAYGG